MGTQHHARNEKGANEMRSQNHNVPPFPVRTLDVIIREFAELQRARHEAAATRPAPHRYVCQGPLPSCVRS